MNRSLGILVVVAIAASAGCAAPSSTASLSPAQSSEVLPTPSTTPAPTPIPSVVCDGALAVLTIADTPLTQLSAHLAEARKLISARDLAIVALPEFERPLLRDIIRVRDALDFVESANNDAAVAYLAEARDDVEVHYQVSCHLPS